MLKIELLDIDKDLLVKQLRIHSIELSIYLVDVVIDDLSFRVYENEKPLRRKNYLEIIKLFAEHQVEEVLLLHESAYDEMIGQPGRLEPNRMTTRIRLAAG